MTSPALRVIERGVIPKGSEEYEVKRIDIMHELGAKIPESLRLPAETIANPTSDITGVPRSCGLLSLKELEITENFDAVALAQAVAEGRLTAVQVATAFAKRAAIAHQLTACLTDWFMDEAIERAQYLDDYLKRNGKTMGPLHGVPISVKEHIPLKGHNASWGMLATRTMCAEDCLTTSIFRAAGAVYYCKTNQPQEIMHLECDSFYGRTLNPHNIDLSSGGSSGGESALLACRGSVLGIGTDIGGSIRGPAGFCGLYGFKPTAYTLTMKDHLPGGFPAELNILASVGPMCHSLRDCDLFVRVMKAADQHLLDPRVVPLPWTGLSTPPKRPIKIGLMKTDNFIVPQPPVLKALEWAENKLSAAEDVVLKPFTPFEAATAWYRIRKAYFPESAIPLKTLLEASGEPMFPLTKEIIQHSEDTKERTATEIMKTRWDRDNFRCDFARHWNAQDVDYIICPVYNGPACAHDTSFNWNYTAFWNYVDCPAIVVPTPIKAGSAKEGYPPEYATPLGEEDELQRKLWQEADFVGAPINLQIVARKWYDNELFGALNALKDVLELSQGSSTRNVTIGRRCGYNTQTKMVDM